MLYHQLYVFLIWINVLSKLFANIQLENTDIKIIKILMVNIKYK